MSELGIISITVQSGDVVWTKSTTDAGGGRLKHTIDLPAGKSGSSVNGGTDTVITLGAGHGLTTSDKIGVFGTFGKRLNMTISAYDTTTITITTASGRGDSYPSGTVTVTVAEQVAVPDIDFDGANAEFYLAKCDQPSAIEFLDDSSDVLFTSAIATADGADYWSNESGDARPTSDEVVSAIAYNGSTTAATMTVVVILET